MSLNEVWEGAAESPFYPLVSKERQFLVGFSLLLIGQCNFSCSEEWADHKAIVLTGLYGLSK